MRTAGYNFYFAFKFRLVFLTGRYRCSVSGIEQPEREADYSPHRGLDCMDFHLQSTVQSTVPLCGKLRTFSRQ